MRLTALLLALVVSSGCDLLGLGGDLELSTDQASYAVEDTARLTLRNDSGRAVALGPLSCAELEVQVDGRWQAGPESLRYCEAILLGLAPGDVSEADVPIDLGLTLGTYRFVLAVGDPGDYPERFQLVRSNPFEVR